MDSAVRYLSEKEAIEIEEMLMGPSVGFSLDQLMEFFGLSIAAAIAEIYKSNERGRILLLCGPGSNGGNGLVAARHLHHFGYKPNVCYPKSTPQTPHTALVTQLVSLSIPFLSVEDLPLDLSNEFDIVVDAVFGYSVHGLLTSPFDDLIKRLVYLLNNGQTAGHQSTVVVSVDVPSGWHVEEGHIDGQGIKPDMLVSLIAPKLCAKKFSGSHHFLGGRFVPPSIAEKYMLHLPSYPGTSMCVQIGKPSPVEISSLQKSFTSSEFLENHLEANPIDQFRTWFNDALAAGLPQPNVMALSTAGKDGKPSSRMLLLKELDSEGFVWSTNTESRKAREISENPYGSIIFYWDNLSRQVRVEGTVENVSDEESEKHFRTRPRAGQIGALVSKQSTIICGRDVLHQEYAKLEAKFSDGLKRMLWDCRSLIPKPKHWLSYRLKPEIIEFWQGQQSRMHDRLQFRLSEIDGAREWKIVRLAP
ncbi:hypothetical protein IFM89_007047 [Coptis chinensis]|uniref:NAD(P)H-hydrate epimerase n=1 Tax=Coptis chinensis TaxID=261450 RepID=A0A835HIZ4_9MAGN|nr:hypothetical protein IFM89_007047 [Coptis chinensis]